jgi:peroxisomal membrane protein 4
LYPRLKDKLHFILDATFQHARNLAYFVTLYKSLMLVQRLVQQKEMPHDSFLAGVVGGYIVFGKNNNINNQAS